MSSDMVRVQSPSGRYFNVHRDHAPRFTAFLAAIEKAGYPIHQDQSGGYNYRNIAGTNKLSNHAHGRAIDLNWNVNPRDRNNPYGDIGKRLGFDVVNRISKEHGMTWGGNWKNPDAMHFEIGGDWKPTGAPGSNPAQPTALQQIGAGIRNTVNGAGDMVRGLGNKIAEGAQGVSFVNDHYGQGIQWGDGSRNYSGGGGSMAAGSVTGTPRPARSPRTEYNASGSAPAMVSPAAPGASAPPPTIMKGRQMGAGYRDQPPMPTTAVANPGYNDSGSSEPMLAESSPPVTQRGITSYARLTAAKPVDDGSVPGEVMSRTPMPGSAPMTPAMPGTNNRVVSEPISEPMASPAQPGAPSQRSALGSGLLKAAPAAARPAPEAPPPVVSPPLPPPVQNTAAPGATQPVMRPGEDVNVMRRRQDATMWDDVNGPAEQRSMPGNRQRPPAPSVMPPGGEDALRQRATQAYGAPAPGAAPSSAMPNPLSNFDSAGQWKKPGQAPQSFQGLPGAPGANAPKPVNFFQRLFGG